MDLDVDTSVDTWDFHIPKPLLYLSLVSSYYCTMVLGTHSSRGQTIRLRIPLVISISLSLLSSSFIAVPALADDTNVDITNIRDLEAQIDVPDPIKPLNLPEGFTQNRGQLASDEVKYYSRSSSGGIAFTASAVVLTVIDHGPSQYLNEDRWGQMGRWENPDMKVEPPEPVAASNIWFTFDGSAEVLPEGQGMMTGYQNFFIGGDSSSWQTRVHSYEAVAYLGLYEGIDLVYSLRQGVYKYEYIVHP